MRFCAERTFTLYRQTTGSCVRVCAHVMQSKTITNGESSLKRSCCAFTQSRPRRCGAVTFGFIVSLMHAHRGQGRDEKTLYSNNSNVPFTYIYMAQTHSRPACGRTAYWQTRRHFMHKLLSICTNLERRLLPVYIPRGNLWCSGESQKVNFDNCLCRVHRARQAHLNVLESV